MAGECPRGAPGPGERAGALALEGFLRRRVYPEQREHRGRERESRAVQALVGWLMARVHDCDPQLFTGEALLVGSQAQDLHVQAESGRGDYDVLAPIQFRTPLLLLGSLYRQPRTRLRFLPSWLCLRPGVPVYRWENKLLADYNTVTLRDTLDSKFLETELTDADIAEINRRQRDLWRGGIDPFLVTRKLHEFVTKALTLAGREPAAGISRLRLRDFAERPAVQLRLEVGGRAVAIELVPAIQDKVDMSLEWPRQDLRWLSAWGDRERGTVRGTPPRGIMETYKTRAQLVAKNLYWRLNFSQAETRLLRDLDADGGRRREALQLLKQVSLEQWGPRYGEVLTPYRLKMLLFWASDLHPDPQAWATVPGAVGTLLKVLEFCLETRQLPSYFLPSLNFLEWRGAEEERALWAVGLEALWREVRLMRCSPELYLGLSSGPAQPQGPEPFLLAQPQGPEPFFPAQPQGPEPFLPAQPQGPEPFLPAQPQGPEPFLQRARELQAFREEHRQDLAKLPQLKAEKQPGSGAASVSFAQQRRLGSCLGLDVEIQQWAA